MKATLALLLTLLASVCPVIAAEDDALIEAAAAKRSAALKLSLSLPAGTGGDYDAYGLGVFISNDGLALVNLLELARSQKPSVLTADGTELPLGTILGIFPEQELALVKFDHRPKVWAPIATKEPEVGENIAIPALCYQNSWSEVVPPIQGPVLAKRSTIGGNLRVTQFRKVLSLGAGLSIRQKGSFAQGSFAINAQGQLVAVKAGVRTVGRQTLILLASVSGLAKQVDKMAKEKKAIPFPLPEASNPIDPMLVDPDYRSWNLAMKTNDREASQKYFTALRRSYPDNARLNAVVAGLMLASSGQPVADLTAIPKLEGKASAAEQVQRLEMRAAFLANTNRDVAGAIRELTAALALCPKDYPDIRTNLAARHSQLDHHEVAEGFLREAYVAEPDSMGLVETFERLLTKQGKYNEAQKFTERLYELDRLYRAK